MVEDEMRTQQESARRQDCVGGNTVLGWWGRVVETLGGSTNRYDGPGVHPNLTMRFAVYVTANDDVRSHAPLYLVGVALKNICKT